MASVLKMLLPALMLTLLPCLAFSAPPVKISDASQECIDCHASVTPGIVGDWRTSRHAKTTPALAMAVKGLGRKVSAASVPPALTGVAVGCAECHHGGKSHADSFAHNGHRIHVVVSPADCARCHAREAAQYKKNLMSHAYGNLAKNPIYMQMVRAGAGLPKPHGGLAGPDPLSKADACFYCHGTVVKVVGMKNRETSEGEMTFPVLSGWPNRGVGRINPDGSKGACGACHPRHSFSMAVARKPYTCAQCHKGPDVPAYKVYSVSKHGILAASKGSKWNFSATPWQVGKHFSAPTCAACHISLVTNGEGDVVSKRTHQINDRLSMRLLGLPYSVPHPKSPDTSLIKNADGQNLPATLAGKPAAGFLIGKQEMAARRARLTAVCRACHGGAWVAAHFRLLDRSIKTTNLSTARATAIMLAAWKSGASNPKDGMFNDPLERRWTEHWLFFANSTRLASAMMGADYGTFAHGRWYLNRNLGDMRLILRLLRKAAQSPAAKTGR